MGRSIITNQLAPQRADQQRTPFNSRAQPRRQRNGPATDLQRAIGNRAINKLLRSRENELEKEEIIRPKFDVSTSAGASFPGTTTGRPLDVLQTGGRALDNPVRQSMETRFGRDFSGVRIHTGARAAQSATHLHALAYTTGANIVFGAGQYRPHSPEGQRLLAHELTHVVQQDGKDQGAIQRFHLPHGAHTPDESASLAPTFADLLATIKAIINDSIIHDGLDNRVNMDLFVKKAGGQSANDKIDKALGSTPKPVASMLNYRYQFTCRCGLIDMRHFLQLMYMSNFFASAFPGVNANRAATNKGREHELTHESESRFGPEDTPSNAMGAFTGTGLAMTPAPDDLLKAIETTLRRCDPLNFSSLSPASQDTVKHFYGDLIADPAPKTPGDLIPANQNQTAVPFVANIPECGGKDRSFPFSIDSNDPDRKTIGGTAFSSGSSGLTSDSDIRDFVSTQRTEVIKSLPTAEKLRLCKRLFSGWVSDEDLDAIESIFKNATFAEKTLIKAALNPNDLSNLGQRTRLRTLFS